MINFLLARVGSAIVTIFGASVLAFLVLRAVPTNPARLIAGPFATEEVIAQVTASLGFDKPLPVQYFDYIVSFFSGDWGFSYSAGQPVLSQILQRLPASAELALYAFLFAFIGAVMITVVINYLRSVWLDRLLRLVSFVSVGVPPFWLALLFLMVFFEQLGWFPGPVGRGPAPEEIRTGLYTIDYLLAGNFSGFGT